MDAPMTTQPEVTTRSEEVVRKHKEYLWPAVTNFYKEPLVADHAISREQLENARNEIAYFFAETQICPR